MTARPTAPGMWPAAMAPSCSGTRPARQATARNTGARVASAPILAFLDDDCEPEPGWAEQAAAAFHDDVIGVAGALLVTAARGSCFAT